MRFNPCQPCCTTCEPKVYQTPYTSGFYLTGDPRYCVDRPANYKTAGINVTLAGGTELFTLLNGTFNLPWLADNNVAPNIFTSHRLIVADSVHGHCGRVYYGYTIFFVNFAKSGAACSLGTCWPECALQIGVDREDPANPLRLCGTGTYTYVKGLDGTFRYMPISSTCTEGSYTNKPFYCRESDVFCQGEHNVFGGTLTLPQVVSISY